MNMNPVSAQSLISAKGFLNAAEDPQIKSLEQKLSQLNKEKEKAEKAKNLDKVRELERKIQEIERRLETLRKKKAEKEGETGTKASPSRPDISRSDVGNYVDESV